MSHDQNLMKNLLALKKRSFDVSFNLSGSGYTSLENIGSGAYGVVCCARHDVTGDKVAIKKIPNIFDLTTTAKRTYREIKILRHFNHDNVISIREILKVSNPKSFKDVYVVLDLMESDLHRIIHSSQPLTEEHVRYFIYQIFRGLKYIHSASIIHRDLKPSNILVNENCLLKIGDFGMARGVSEPGKDLVQHHQCLTQYVATRWYRAPELIMLFDDYTEAVDMWSTGCILAEMLGRKQIFPAKDILSQLQMIISSLGSPPDHLLERSQSDIVRGLVKSVKMNENPEPFSVRYPNASKKAIDLLNGLLVLDPNKRLTASQALRHLFVNKYHDPNDEPICSKFDFSFESQPLSCVDLREAILSEINSFHHRNQRENLVQTDSSEPLQFLLHPDNAFKVPVVASTALDCTAVSTDVEMLSAKSTNDVTNKDDVIIITSESVQKPEFEPYTLEPSTSKYRPDLTVSTKPVQKINKTISDDTKALIKAALLQSNTRRKMSEGDGQVKKPVTAQQRQKEREERRRKKNEKSKRKSKDKTEEVLTQEDKSMLERWQNMAPQKETAKVSKLDEVPQNFVGADLMQKFPATNVDSSVPIVIGTPLTYINQEPIQPIPPGPVYLDPITKDTFQPDSVQKLTFISPQKDYGLWTDRASPNTKQTFIQTHTLLDQLQDIQRTNPLPTIAIRDPLMSQGLEFSDHTDSVADVTKQLSRSQMDDAPNLVHTPKGCGEGYGVGLDLDEILHEWIVSNKSDVTPGSAPLSASMLTDWLQVAGNVDPKDLPDLQRELDLSPMVTAD